MQTFSRLLPADRIHSVFSHIYDISSLKCQYEEFVALTKNFPVKKHIFASNFSSLADRLDYVRCGIALYGYGALNLEKVMRLTADVISVRKVAGGRQCRVQDMSGEKEPKLRHE